MERDKHLGEYPSTVNVEHRTQHSAGREKNNTAITPGDSKPFVWKPEGPTPHDPLWSNRLPHHFDNEKKDAR